MKKILIIISFFIFLAVNNIISFSQTISVSGVDNFVGYVKKYPLKTVIGTTKTIDLIIKLGASGTATSVTSVKFLPANSTTSGEFSILVPTLTPDNIKTDSITVQVKFDAEGASAGDYTDIISVVLDDGEISFGIKATAAEYIYGDADGDGIIYAYDAAQVLKKVVLLPLTTALSPSNMASAMDVSGDGTITSYDASLILQYVVGIINQFYAGSNEVTLPKEAIPEITDAKYGNAKIDDNQLIIPINIEASNIYSLEASYSFNPLYVDFKEIKFSENFVGMITEKNVLDNTIHFAVAGDKTIELTGEVIYLIFDIKEENPDGNIMNCEKLILNEYEVELEETAFKSGAQIPSYYVLNQNYPNPFNMETVIKFGIPEAGKVEFKVFNVLGQVVWSFERDFKAGYHSLQWFGKSNRGIPLSSGVYIYQMRAGDFVQSKKLAIIK